MDKENNPVPEGDKKPEGDGQEDNKPVTFTQEQVNDIVSKRLAEANTKAEKKLKDEVSKAVAEAERRSKLSEDEREKEIKAKQKQELDDRERKITLRNNRARKYFESTSKINASGVYSPITINGVVKNSLSFEYRTKIFGSARHKSLYNIK